MKITPVLFGIAILSLVTACADVAETGRGTMSFGDPAPRSRTGQAIIVGKDDVIRVADLTPAEYRQHLFRTAHRFERNTNGTVYFARKSSELDAAARATLLGQADWITSNRQVRVSVVGHADDFDDSVENRELGLERARSVVTFLVRNGVEQRRLIALTSEGDRAQIASGRDDARLNRRVQTIVTELIEVEDEDLSGQVMSTGSGPVREGDSEGRSGGGSSAGGGRDGGGSGGSSGGGGGSGSGGKDV